MSLSNVGVVITMPQDPSTGLFAITDRIQLLWDLDDLPDERERVRTILQEAWSELYDDKAQVVFTDECPDCGKLKVICICPSAIDRG